MPISHGQMALKLGITQPAVTQLVKKGMPLSSYKTTIRWRMENCPKWNPTEQEKKLALKYGLIDRDPEPSADLKDALSCVTPPSLENLSSSGSDFDELMVQQCEAVTTLAYKMYTDAVEQNNTARVSSALKNWSEAAKNAASVRERFLTLKTESRNLVSLDEVVTVVGEEIVEWRRLFTTLGSRLAGLVSPEVSKLITEQVDTVMQNMSRAEERATRLFNAEEASDE